MSIERRALLVRADASVQIGTGHVMRCLALAQAWQDAGGRVTFAMALDAPVVQARLESEGICVARIDASIGNTDDAAQTIALARESDARWVVLDGYQFDAEYQRAVKDAGLSLLCLDDNGDATHYYADIVLNQNIHADARLYTQREPHIQLLLGTRYALLRREFRQWRDWKRTIPNIARRVLVTLGGSDPDNVTLKVIEALQHVAVENLEAVVVIGASNPYAAELSTAARASRVPIRLETNATNMSDLMAWADVAISGAGSTCWELAFMGLPSVVLVLAQNQKRIGEHLGAQGVAIHLGDPKRVGARDVQQALAKLLSNSERRVTMSRNGRVLIDGKGAVRVVNQMNDTLTLRPVRDEDCQLIGEWANEPQVRESAFHSEPIDWATHEKWFYTKLSDSRCRIFIAIDSEGMPIGQIRFDSFGEGQAVIDLSITPQRRGMGYGSKLIDVATRELFNSTLISQVHAFVKASNLASIKAFAKARFKLVGSEIVNGISAAHYLRVKSDE